MRRTPTDEESGPGRSAGPAGQKKSPGGGPLDPNQRRTTIAWIIAGALLLILFQSTFVPGPRTIPFSRFLELVDSGRVTRVDISETSVDGTYTTGDGEDQQDVRFTTTITPNFETNSLVRRLERQGVEFSGSQQSPWAALLFGWVIPFGLIGLLWYFLFYRRMRKQLGAPGGPLSLGKNKAKLYDRTDLKTTFADVAVVDEVEAELQELVDYLRSGEKFARVGARIPRGVLLVGPPGTGKTLLARAVAGEARVPFYYVSASEFVELFVGLGAARVRDMF